MSRYVRLDHSLLETRAYRSLSVTARALLIEFDRIIHPGNNGRVFISVRDAARLLGVSNLTTARGAIGELIDRAFLVIVAESSFDRKAASGTGEGRARVWRATWEAVASKAGPSNEFRAWALDASHPEFQTLKRRVETATPAILQRRFGTVAEADPYTLPVISGSNGAVAEADSYTTARKKPQIVVGTCECESDTHIGYHGDERQRGSVSACNKARQAARAWLIASPDRTQGRLAKLTAIHASKLSRFLANTSGAQTLTFAQLDVLNGVVASGAQTGKHDRGSYRVRATAPNL